jgi:hypothetical protein
MHRLPRKNELNFGYQCLANRDWSRKTAYVLLQAHEQLAKEVGDQVAYSACVSRTLSRTTA